MLAQRAVHLSLRRFAATNPSTLNKTPSLAKFLAPSAIATGKHIQHRPAATQATSQDDAYSILAAQRRNRPISPHLGIYRPQMTWYPSMLNRITGVTLSGGLYLYAVAYLVAPLFGWHLESASLAAAFASWPLVAKIMTKMVIAMPFTFHSINGVRHLIWDAGMQLKNQQVINTGWAVVGLSVASALGLAFL